MLDEKTVTNVWKIQRVTPRIFSVTFDNGYDLAMHFLRYQEYYESPNPTIRKNFFTIIDYMAWYAKNHDGTFTYPADWTGFNVPGWVFKALIESGEIPDPNMYDFNMSMIIGEIQSQLPDDVWNFYVIGFRQDDKGTKDHELAHGLYLTEEKYKQQMDALTEKHKDVLAVFSDWLSNIGYDSSVFADEFQAYFSTGLTEDGKKVLKKAKLKTKKIRKEYEKVFTRWKKISLGVIEEK